MSDENDRSQDRMDPQTNALIPDSVYTELAIEIIHEHRDTTIGFALRVGKMVVKRLYGGNIENWRNHGESDGSMKRLADEIAERGGRNLSLTTLQNAVGTLDLDLRVGVSARPQLTYTHVRAVIGLPAAKQEKLLGDAESNDWDTTQMKHEVAKVRRRLSGRKGRKPKPESLKTIHAWGRALTDRRAFHDLDKLAQQPKDVRVAALSTLQALVEHCQKAIAALGLDPDEKV
jgi:hypothetical protein